MVPIIAPSIGQAMLALAPWRFVFVLFAAFGGSVWLWAMLRLKETLHPEYRLTLTGRHVWGAVKIVLGDRTSLYYSLAVMVMIGSLLAYVGMVQQIFADVFRRASLMPTMFALCAMSMGAAAIVNSRIVERLGMRRISHAALLAFIGVTATHFVVAALGFEQIWTFVVLQSATMACFSLAVSNFGAMALEPVGAVAGIGASLQGFMTMTGGALIALLIGWQFNGTTVPLAGGALICGILSLLFVLRAERWRLFRPHHAPAGQAA
jgi:DHA1 family bicyclomycin/chloramphenicol resistance-like MFS transporter